VSSKVGAIHIFDNNDVSSTFYVLLCRRYMNSHFQKGFVVLSSSVVSSFINSKTISDRATLSLRISLQEGKFVLNNAEDSEPLCDVMVR